MLGDRFPDVLEILTPVILVCVLEKKFIFRLSLAITLSSLLKALQLSINPGGVQLELKLVKNHTKMIVQQDDCVKYHFPAQQSSGSDN